LKLKDSPSDLPDVSEPALKKLEFDKVLYRISQFCASEIGRDLVKSTLPKADRDEILKELQRVSEAKQLLIDEGNVPLDGIKNISVALKKTSVENQTLSIQELLEVASTLRTSRSMHVFLNKRSRHYELLAQFVPMLLSEKVVEYNIDRALDPQGFVKDGASKELRTIRQDIVSVSDQLRKRLASLLKEISDQELLQEEIITTRDGRLVIPVKAEHKKHVRGFIHSSSSSGATVYIEPAETLDLNNALRELRLQEEREIQRILQELTSQVREIREALEMSFHALSTLDMIFAKAKYSIEIIGNPPRLSRLPRIKLHQARHPVLLQRHARETVVPLDIALGDEARTLIITGPNAGGKTVALKTIGISVLCTMAGIHIPAGPESEVFPFRRIFVDIGDDQSIENDLSTFSSHLLQLKEILGGANSETLILMDEIGAGTDPSEGAALAAAVLEQLTARAAITVATTHNGILKVFAHETPGMANGSMEFDQISLRPTYRFRYGVPGSSFALELAERMGITRAVLEKARAQLGNEKSKLERLISDLERQSQELSRRLKEISNERDKLQSLVQAYEQKMTELRRELSDIRRKAVDEARELVKEAQSTIERAVKEIRESAAASDVIRSSKQKIKQIVEKLPEHPSEKMDPTDAVLNVGDAVRIRGSSETAEVVELDGNMATVLRGVTRIRVRRSDLDRNTALKHAPAGSERRDSYSLEAKKEIDLRGLMGDEAIEQVQRFLDNAYASGLHRVDIIHGKGTGALRKRIAEFLKTYPKTKSFRLGEWNEGGTGVTVVELAD